MTLSDTLIIFAIFGVIAATMWLVDVYFDKNKPRF